MERLNTAFAGAAACPSHRDVILLVLAAVIFYLIPGLSPDAYALVTAGVVLVAMGVVIMQTILYLRSL